jgi:adenine specific DNA methylase Mod/very-short-patch-repair endonuclease
MAKNGTKEQKFYNALQDIFIGAKIEGQGGFVNLMKIKSNYYSKIEKILKDDIDKALKQYPSFREELFDKLYTFFSRYFTESGSIYFNSTPFHNNVYEKVYTDDKDVILFWKTQMLYYVKTDRIFRSMPVVFDGYKFYFDATTIENKKANEKRSLIYELKEVKEDKTIVFNVYYSEKGRVTKTEDILKELKKKEIKLDEEQLERAFRIFEKQSEVDFFINKNAKAFLQEQFKLWSYQYFWDGAEEWTADRVNQLQILKDIAFKIIDFVSQFEDELVKIWNKPKFVKNSNYVITLDRIYQNLPSDRVVGGVLSSSDRGAGGVPKWYELPFNPNLKERARELRKAGNLAEIIFWKQVRNKQFLGLDFDRQKIVGNYIVDFYCKELGVVVEIDGDSHNEKMEYDAKRDEYLKSLGLKVYHVRAEDVLNNIEGVMKFLETELTPLTPLRDGNVTPLTPLQEGNLVEKIFNHPNINEQIKEWQELGIVDENFKIEDVFETDLTGKHLSKKYEHLPIDTKYFKDLELEILSLFDDLDNSLDGWLIKSENYQALNTILPKFKEKVQTIYIDPPFNLDSSDQFLYRTNYKDANWATLLENRLRIAREWLNEKGSIFVRCDYNGNWIVRCLLDEIFGKENFRNEIIINRKRQSIGTPDKLENESENLFLYSKTEFFHKNDIYKSRSLTNIKWTGFLKQEKRNPPERYFFGKKLIPPDNQHFSLIQEKVDKLLNENYLRLKCKECDAIYYFDDEERKEKFIDYILKAKDKFKYYDITNKSKVYGIKTLDKCLNCNSDNWKVEYLTSDESKITDNWKDIPSYSDTQNFSTENSENLLKRVVELTTKENNIVIDFFLGSGTTIAVAHKLGRKWIGVEMGEHFYTVVLPRMKKVLFYDKSGISKEVKEYQGGGFFKYYELEQYEETLANTVYENHDMLVIGDKSPYEQYVFMKDEKMLKALEIDYENKKVNVDLSKLYENIDIAETISNLTGNWIKKIRENGVEFEEGSVMNTKNLDYKLIKHLIWWE